jgi:hypothetical protein
MLISQAANAQIDDNADPLGYRTVVLKWGPVFDAGTLGS